MAKDFLPQPGSLAHLDATRMLMAGAMRHPSNNYLAPLATMASAFAMGRSGDALRDRREQAAQAEALAKQQNIQALQQAMAASGGSMASLAPFLAGASNPDERLNTLVKMIPNFNPDQPGQMGRIWSNLFGGDAHVPADPANPTAGLAPAEPGAAIETRDPSATDQLIGMMVPPPLPAGPGGAQAAAGRRTVAPDPANPTAVPAPPPLPAGPGGAQAAAGRRTGAPPRGQTPSPGPVSQESQRRPASRPPRKPEPQEVFAGNLQTEDGTMASPAEWPEGIPIRARVNGEVGTWIRRGDQFERVE